MPHPSRDCRGLVAALLLLALPGRMPAAEAAGAPAGQVREPAVAGLFYPKEPAELAREVDACLSAAPEQPVGDLKALVCPHAGYPFSGPVAAYAYRLLAGRKFDTVVVMGPSHYAYLVTGSVSAASAYRTPLGDVPVSPKAAILAGELPFELEPRCYVERPGWWRQASRPLPERETADTWEHSVEVEIPFLQRTLGRFSLVPVVCGQMDTARAARALSGIVDDQTLVIASSDLSHYHTYDQAVELDRGCVDAICRLDIRAMEGSEACGRTPILILMHLARDRGWKARLLDMRNSGDTSGAKGRVVGYAAIAFYAPFGRHLGTDDRQALLRIARDGLRAATGGGGPSPKAAGDAALSEPRGCFVTLTEQGALRGCIGNLAASGSLMEAVAANARSAALRDPRFRPVAAEEVPAIKIEVSVLSEPRQLFYSSPDDLLRKLVPGADGVVFRLGNRGATYLPQVWGQIPDKREFMDSLAEKAGCEAADWRSPNAAIFVYEVESFKEPETAAP